MKLTAIEQREVARKAQFFLDVDYGRFGNDTVIIFGDGIEDLDRAISTLTQLQDVPKSKVQIDLGSMYSVYKPCDIEDLYAIRNYYLGFYGEVNKPDAYLPERTVGFQNPPTTFHEP